MGRIGIREGRRIRKGGKEARDKEEAWGREQEGG